MHTDKGSSSESTVRGKRSSKAGLLLRLLGRPDSAPHGEHQAPRAPGRVCSPGQPKAVSVGAQRVYDRRRFPSTLLPSRDMCRCLGPDPACLGSCHSPNSGEAAPEARPAGGALRPRLIGECTASREASLLGGRGGSKSPSS